MFQSKFDGRDDDVEIVARAEALLLNPAIKFIQTRYLKATRPWHLLSPIHQHRDGDQRNGECRAAPDSAKCKREAI